MDRKIDIQIDGQKFKSIHFIDIKSRQIDRQSDRHIDRKIDRYRDVQNDRQTQKDGYHYKKENINEDSYILANG